MTIRLYLDEDSMDRDLVRALRGKRVDVLTAAEAGLVQRPDPAHLEFASANNRVLYSSNIADFCRLHSQYAATGKTHGGIILAPQQRYSVGERLRRLRCLMATRTSLDMLNRLEFLSSWG